MAGTIDLGNRCALITGAARGIGRAIALNLAEAGANIAVNYRQRDQEANEGVEAIRNLGARAIAGQADVSDATTVKAMGAKEERENGCINNLVNKGGHAPHRSLDDLTEADFDHTIAVNLKSAFLCTQLVLPHMRAQQWGRIVNISSGAARGAGVVGAHYNASKAGMEGLTRGYAARLVKE